MQKPSYYAVLTAEVRYDPTLTANAKLLYAEITALANISGKCYADDKYFTELFSRGTTKKTDRSIRNWINELITRGYITRENQQGKSRVLVLGKKFPTPTNGSEKNFQPLEKNFQPPFLSNEYYNNNITDKGAYTEKCNEARVKKERGSLYKKILLNINPDLWNDWIEHRREIKKPLRGTTMEYQLKQLYEWKKQGHDINKIIETSIKNGYQGLFAPKTPATKAKGTNKTIDEVFDALNDDSAAIDVEAC